MQAVAAEYARLFNSFNPPRRVEFLTAWIMQRTTLNSAFYGVEPFIAGEYRKHNNNCGYVSELERNTPQAFSHFTYEKSKKQLRVSSALEIAEQIGFVPWVDVDVKAAKGTYKALPERAELPPDIDEALVVALYSK